MFQDDEKYSRKFPLNEKIKDTDVFLHGTSSKRYDAIKSTGYLLRDVSVLRNFSISQPRICFEKYVTSGKLANGKTIDLMEKEYCFKPCKTDGCLEGVILEISGKALKKLDCPILADWSNPIPRTRNSLGDT